VAPLTWIESNGGPLVVLPRALLAAWRGTDDPLPGEAIEATFRWNPGGVATDYDRACDVRDYAGVIAVGSGEALVLADEPLPTTWLPGHRGGVFVRWRFGPDEACVAAILEGVYPTASIGPRLLTGGSTDRRWRFLTQRNQA
jgi:hypothetical protein